MSRGWERVTLDNNTEARMCASQSQHYNAVAKYLLDLGSDSSEIDEQIRSDAK